ncbi:septum formation initiator family protein [Candidatus Margulisiibacteriota bacterium]
MAEVKLFSRWGEYLILLLSIYILIISGQTISRTNAVKTEQLKLSERISTAQEKNTELNRITRVLNTNSYLENLARKKLGLVKSGEVVYKIVKNNH